MEYLQVAIGLAVLVLAGEALVRGAVNMSLRLGVPALIVSLTVVAFGTSAPELLISIQAVLDGAPGIALGNVVGSNTANVLLVLGIPAMISGIAMTGGDTRASYLTMLAATALFIGLCFTGTFTWVQGAILLAVLAAILGWQMREALAHRRHGRPAVDPGEVEGADPSLRWWKILAFLAVGLVGLPLGADMLVTGATVIASRFGVSDTVIGLTLVAIGTSLPELATSVAAALKRQADVAIGNVIGSNMFNLLAIIGIASLVGPIPVDPAFLRLDLWVMLGTTLLIAPFIFLGRTITMPWGAAFFVTYAGYLWLLVR